MGTGVGGGEASAPETQIRGGAGLVTRTTCDSSWQRSCSPLVVTSSSPRQVCLREFHLTTPKFSSYHRGLLVLLSPRRNGKVISKESLHERVANFM
ncbi:uncharacterized protein [Triticum aestivum]|uniref:uncharacterized protein isoform X2 n=1 Tax=Triticum aestivum TaxID=4565 RepID=UPI001D02C8C0|nr:uncharacterized protein LOC123135916 isoform X2 [Triticum aestivum]XP_044411097.1 uncharacterized protein LOC123135916 isoform X2 [Triticum aestivum]XP_044411098.1 uncharacterized protein LOC123135916 isoform X2 [Triticum aestivum]